MKKILHIDTDLQQVNRIHKDGSNKVKQITDKVNNTPFVSDAGNEPIFSYEDGYKFDGINDILYSNKNVDTTGLLTIEFWLKLNTTSGAQMIMSGDGTSAIWELYFNNKTLTLYSPSGGGIGVNFDAEDLTSTHFHIAMVFEGTYIYTFFNGVLYSSNLHNGGLDNSGFLQFGRVKRVSSFPLNGYIKGIRFYNYLKYDTTGVVGSAVFTPKQPFSYYKRYREDGNKKLFISSRYLKDAVIDSSDRIESIESEIDKLTDSYLANEYNPILHQLDITKQPLYTKEGLYFDKTRGDYLYSYNSENSDARVGSITPSDDLTVMFWHKPTSMASHQGLFGGGPGVGGNDVNIFWNGVQNPGYKYEIYPIMYPSNTYPLDVFNHICYINKNDIAYLIINGILIDSASDVLFDTDQAFIATFGTCFGTTTNMDGYIDDQLVSFTAEIDPTGYTIGDKVFEPPRRRSLEVKQYQGRELANEAKLSGNDMLYLNSRYLYNSTIDNSNNEITDIYSEEDEIFSSITGLPKPIIDGKNGIRINVVNGVLQKLDTYAANVMDFGTGDFHVSYWVKPDAVGTKYSLRTSNTYFVIRNSKISYYDNGFHDSTLATLLVANNWHHLTYIRRNGILYLIQDGILALAEVNTYNLVNNIYLQLGNPSGATFLGNFDDVLVVNGNSLIDPSSFSVGDKVFRLPRRSSSQLQNIN